MVDKKTSDTMYYRSCVRPTAPGAIMLPNGAYLPNLQGASSDKHTGMVAGCFKYYSDDVSLDRFTVVRRKNSR